MANRKEPGTDLEPAAGNGLLHRRVFLGAGAMAGVLGAAGMAHAEPLTVPEWVTKPGKRPLPYTQPSPFEGKVQRTIPDQNPLYEPGSAAGRTPHQFLEGMVTPNGLHFEVTHNGVPDIDPDKHLLVIHGLVKRPLKFTVNSLLRYPLTSRFHFVECAGNSGALYGANPVKGTVQQLHGLLSGAEWTGVMLSTLLEEAGIDPKATWLIAEGADSLALSRSVPMTKALDDTMVALYQNGERLNPGNGYPMRLVVPGWEGNLQVKWLRRIQLTDQPAMSYYESRTYAPILPNGKAYQFFFLQEVKSFITHPSPGLRLGAPGLYEVSGLAYSASGRIAKVMVSADGGKTWAQAALQEPVLPQAFTRFRVPWKWDGGSAVLQSRAWDEAGQVQPTRAQVVAQRGETKAAVTNPAAFPSQHYNGPTSWAIERNGEVKHVYA